MNKSILWIVSGIFVSILYAGFFIRQPNIDWTNSTYITECTNNSDYGSASFRPIIDSYTGSDLNLNTTNTANKLTYKNPLSDAMAKVICANVNIKYITPEEHDALLTQIENDPTTPQVEAGVPNYQIKIWKTVFTPALGNFFGNIAVAVMVFLISIWLWRRSKTN